MTIVKNKMFQFGAVIATALLVSVDAYAAAGAGAANFTQMGTNVINATGSVPGLISTVAYIAGLGLGVLGIMKVKDHVENPSQTPLKDGAVRLGAGGALLALPFLYEVIINNVSAADAGAGAAQTQLDGIDNDTAFAIP